MSVKSLVVVLAAVGVGLFYRSSIPQTPPPQGSCKAAYKEIEEAYRKSFANGRDSGSAFAVYHKGELVCDLWGGWADVTNILPWSENTTTVIFSATKGVCAITLALLRDRGFIDYDKLVSDYWPEFAQNGKENVTVRTLMSHQAGLAAVDSDLTMELIRDDPEEIGRRLAAQKPNWPPGTASGYHALSFGPIVDQLVRRVDPKQRSIQQFFTEEIAEPFDVDIHIGLPHHLQWRAARFMELDLLEWLRQSITSPSNFLATVHMMNSPLMKRMMTKASIDFKAMNWPSTRSTPQGSVLGQGTARALARLYSLTVDVDHHDQRILSEETVDELHKIAHQGTDIIIQQEVKWGPGVMFSPLRGQDCINHPGYGGQLGMGCRHMDLGWAFITNYAHSYLNTMEDPRVEPLVEAMLKVLK